MKRVILMFLVVVVCSGVVFAGGGQSASAGGAKGMKVGVSFHSLSNPTFAALSEALKTLVESNGGQFTYVDSNNNTATMISQLENFIASGVDIIGIEPPENIGFEAVLKQAKDKGIKVFLWDNEMAEADVCWVFDNYALGYVIGEQAAKWINEKFPNGACEVAVLDWPQMQIIIDRANGILDALKKLAPNAKVVAQASAVNATEGMAATETILQAHPNVKVICSIGGGGAIGANEVVKSAGKLTADFGIFAADATPQELDAISKNEAIRMSVLLSGTPADAAKQAYEAWEKLFKGQPVDHLLQRAFIPVTKDNYKQYMQ
jgi:ribose transport system substrate-binding protein